MFHSSEISDYKALSDAELCLLVKKGNDLAFEALSLRYKGLIHKICTGFSCHGYDENDFMQLGLLALLAACKSYDSCHNTSFKNYAALCVRRKCTSLILSENKSSVIPTDAIVPLEQADSLSLAFKNPQSQLERKEANLNAIERIKSELSLMEYCVVKLYISGLSYAEISQSLKISQKSVDNALQRAKKKLLN